MYQIRRLLAVGVMFLAGAVLVTCTDVWGDSGRDQELRNWHKGDGKSIAPPRDDKFSAELEHNRFEDKPVVVYQRGNEAYFALQIKPALPDAPAMPTDYLLVIDTSASKANGPLMVSIEIAQELASRLGAEDRMAIWTANVQPRDLSRGFKSSKDLAETFKELQRETPLGAVDLKKSIAEPLASFQIQPNRRRVLVFFGDGKSVAEPLSDDGRLQLCESIRSKQVAFLAVPMGARPDSKNLHGLVSATGGKVVRHGFGEAIATVTARIIRDAAEPILYPKSFRLTAGTTEVVPTVLPPLRRDTGTLVVGKMPLITKTLDWTVTGTLSGQESQFQANLAVPEADEDHFFLVSVHEQWMNQKDRPALLPSDRSLAFSHMQNNLAVEDLICKAELCLEQNHLDAAQKLYEQAKQLAPHSPSAKGGILLVEKMRTGKKTRQEMLDELRLNATKRELALINGTGKFRRIEVSAEAQEEQQPNAEDPPRDPIDDVKMRRQIAIEQANLSVNEAIRQANRLVRTDPDAAYELLKRNLDGVRSNTDLEPSTIANLSSRLSRAMESTARMSAVIKRDQAEALALRAAADARLDLRRAETIQQDRVRERMRVYRNLMDQAREDEAFRQALAIRNDQVSQGRPVPPAVTSAYQTALTGYHLREITELKRLREEKFLATLLEVERSHVPFPDEPPVEFPSHTMIKRITRFPGRGGFDNWADWSRHRIKEYGQASFGPDVPGRMFEIQKQLEQIIDYAGTEGIPDPRLTLAEALDQLSKAHKIPITVNEKAFKYEAAGMEVMKTPIAATEPLPAMQKTTLGAVLKKILSRVPVPSEATYLVRRDTVEVTTGFFASAEKVIRVYPVSDLVFPVPNAFNQAAVAQAGTILGTLGQLGIVGQALGAGGLNLGLQLGGGFQLGGIQLGGGLQLGGIQLGGGLQLGAAAGVGQAGGPAGLQVGGFGFQGNQNLGVGGGNLGITGGQLGQLGNLGGQFGIQGGTQEMLLIQLIRQVVGRPKDWAPAVNPITGQPLNPLDDQPGDGSLSQDNNDLGYYPPAACLVVKAPSRLHTRESNLIIQPAAGPAPGGLVAAPKEGNQGDQVAVNKDKEDKKPLDPREVWQNALARAATEPGLIIATADYLATQLNRFDHAAEFLKANLRQGIVVKPWVYQSLAIALRETGGSAEEIERAELSVADLEPLDARGYLVAARSLAEDKNYERALAFCKQAAELAPNLPHPYADATKYAEMAKDANAMKWATSALLKQEWPHRNEELRQTALDRLDTLARQLPAGEGDRLRQLARQQQRRDLVIKLAWQGEADLDLKVEEPTGSVATPLSRQTIGGGTLLADTRDTAETYVASEAFSGDYRIVVEKVWGKPLGNKAQLRIIRHQGTPQETEELVTVKMTSTVSEPVVVKLSEGRRRDTVTVPAPAAHLALDEVTTPLDPASEIMWKLRDLSNAERSGEQVMQGGIYSAGRPLIRSAKPAKPTESDRLLYQNRLQSFVANSVELTAQAVLSADRQSVRLSVSPVVNTVTNRPVRVMNPIIPGSSSR